MELYNAVEDKRIIATKFSKLFPNISFPDGFTDYGAYGYVEILNGNPPTTTPFQTLVELSPELVGDHYEKRWEVVDKFSTAEEVSAHLDFLRDIKLTTIRSEAQERIFDKYPIWKQSNAALGLCTPEYTETMKDYINTVISESNRCETLLDSATDWKEIDIIVASWP